RPAVQRPEEVYAVDLVGQERRDRGRRRDPEAGGAVSVRLIGADAGAGSGRDRLHRGGGVDVAARAALVDRRRAGGPEQGREAGAGAAERERVCRQRGAARDVAGPGVGTAGGVRAVLLEDGALAGTAVAVDGDVRTGARAASGADRVVVHLRVQRLRLAVQGQGRVVGHVGGGAEQ